MSNILQMPQTHLMKLAIHNGNNEQNQDRDDRDGYNPIRSHSSHPLAHGIPLTNTHPQRKRGSGEKGREEFTYAPCPSTS